MKIINIHGSESIDEMLFVPNFYRNFDVSGLKRCAPKVVLDGPDRRMKVQSFVSNKHEKMGQNSRVEPMGNGFCDRWCRGTRSGGGERSSEAPRVDGETPKPAFG